MEPNPEIRGRPPEEVLFKGETRQAELLSKHSDPHRDNGVWKESKKAEVRECKPTYLRRKTFWKGKAALGSSARVMSQRYSHIDKREWNPNSLVTHVKDSDIYLKSKVTPLKGFKQGHHDEIKTVGKPVQFRYQAERVLEESKTQAERSFWVREAREIDLARAEVDGFL